MVDSGQNTKVAGYTLKTPQVMSATHSDSHGGLNGEPEWVACPVYRTVIEKDRRWIRINQSYFRDSKFHSKLTRI